MKKNILVVLSMVAFVIVAVFSFDMISPYERYDAYAASVAPTVAVNATLAAKCTIAANGTITFAIDPSAGSTLNPSTGSNGTNPQVKCTKNTVATISCPATGNLSAGTNTIAYSTTCPANVTGLGFSTAANIPISISVAPSAYQDAPAASYTDTISVTVSF